MKDEDKDDDGGFPFGQRIADYENCTRLAKELLYPIRYAIEECGDTVGDYKIVCMTRPLWEAFFGDTPKEENAKFAALNIKRQTLVAWGPTIEICREAAIDAAKHNV